MGEEPGQIMLDQGVYIESLQGAVNRLQHQLILSEALAEQYRKERDIAVSKLEELSKEMENAPAKKEGPSSGEAGGQGDNEVGGRSGDSPGRLDRPPSGKRSG